MFVRNTAVISQYRAFCLKHFFTFGFNNRPKKMLAQRLNSLSTAAVIQHQSARLDREKIHSLPSSPSSYPMAHAY